MGQAWLCRPIIPTVSRQRQENTNLSQSDRAVGLYGKKKKVHGLGIQMTYLCELLLKAPFVK